MKKAFSYHISAELTAHADITVLADTQQEADAYIARQLNLRASALTGELRESVSEQIRKEMGADAFTRELVEERDATDEDHEMYPDALGEAETSD